MLSKPPSREVFLWEKGGESMRIEVECCEGIENSYRDRCLRDKCLVYNSAREAVDRGWPWLPTGFGNAYGNPSHETYLSKVREQLREEAGGSFDQEPE